MKRTILAALALAALVGACGDDDDGGTTAIDAKTSDSGTTGADASNQVTVYTVRLTKSAEVPGPCASAGAAAGGGATVTVSADESMIAVTNMTFDGLSGAATMAHIHSGASGAVGPGYVLMFDAPTSPVNETFTAASYIRVAGAPTTFAAFVTALKAGRAYINVHTASCSGGEIRGQIQ